MRSWCTPGPETTACRAVWQTWALREIKNNKRQKALDILTQAAKAMPKAGFEKMAAYAYIYPGEKLAQTQDWEAALKLAATGLKTLPTVAQEELHDWRNNIFNRWTITTIEKKEYAVTADILERAIKADPNERDFIRNLGFVIQEWLIATEAKDGLAAAEKLVSEIARCKLQAPAGRRKNTTQ